MSTNYLENTNAQGLLPAHDLVRKPVPTFRDHALARLEKREIAALIRAEDLLSIKPGIAA